MVTGWGDPTPRAVVPVVVEFTTDDAELLTAARRDLEALYRDFALHGNAHNREQVGKAAEALARVLQQVAP